MDFIVLIIIGLFINSVFGDKKKPAQSQKQKQAQAEYEEIFAQEEITDIERQMAQAEIDSENARKREAEIERRRREAAKKQAEMGKPPVEVKLFGSFGELFEEIKKAAAAKPEVAPTPAPKKKRKRKAGSLDGLNPDMATLEGKPIFAPDKPVTVAPQMEVIKQAPKQSGSGLEVITNNKRLTPLQQAMLLSDVLEKPKALRR